jgi:SAM-dependent methyltransferase
MLLEDEHFWEKAWQQERKASRMSRMRTEYADIDWWNRRAPRWAQYSGEEEAKQRVAQLLNWLEDAKALNPHSEALDLGCGAGTDALTLAKQGWQVTALDPARGMLDVLERRAKQEGLANITTVCQRWEDIDLERLGWQRQFDLVTAFKCPAINNCSSLRKMIDACRGFCCFSGNVKRRNAAQAELWQRFFNEDMPSLPADIIYIFHIVLAWGYYPLLKFKHSRQQRELDMDRAVAETEDFFYPYLELTPKIRKEIRSYVEERATRGIFLQEQETVSGLLLWQVNR